MFGDQLTSGQKDPRIMSESLFLWSLGVAQGRAYLDSAKSSASVS